MNLDGRGDGEELGGAKLGETVLGVYCMRKESVSNERKRRCEHELGSSANLGRSHHQHRRSSNRKRFSLQGKKSTFITWNMKEIGSGQMGHVLENFLVGKGPGFILAYASRVYLGSPAFWVPTPDCCLSLVLQYRNGLLCP